jgi:hypothetical protein
VLGIENKLATAKGKINHIRGLYGSGETVLHSTIDEAEGMLDGAAEKAKGMVMAQMADVKILSAAQCLGLQLPIPDLGDVFEKFTETIKGLGDGMFFDKFTAFLDGLMSHLPIESVLAKIRELKDMVVGKIAELVNLDAVFGKFADLQDKMKSALSMVSSVVGCVDEAAGTNLGNHFKNIDSIMEGTNPDFKAGLDAVAEAKKHFSDPMDILNDAKGRITGKLDLDGKMAGLKDQFKKGLGGLV